MKDLIKVSVIIPVYNVEKYIRECLDSIVCQSLQDIEIICIDDYSTDNSKSIVVEYEKKYKQVSVISLDDNHGQAYARNQGLRNAKGRYIYFVDADDKLMNESSLARMFSVAEKYSLDALFFDADVIYENKALLEDKQHYLTMRKEYQNLYQGVDYFSKTIRNGDFTCAVWRSFWRAEFLSEAGIDFNPITSPHEDLLFSFQAMVFASRVKHIKEKLYVYRCRENSSTSGGYSKKRYIAYCYCYWLALDFISKKSFPSKYAPAFSIYLNDIKANIIKANRFLLRQGVDSSGIVENNFFMNCLIQGFMRYMTPFSGHAFTLQEYEKISKAENIIVYGAGDIGCEVARYLEWCGFKKYYVASTEVTVDEQYVCGKKVTPLKELLEIRNTSVILLAASSKYIVDMKDYLLKLGFDNYIDMFR